MLLRVPGHEPALRARAGRPQGCGLRASHGDLEHGAGDLRGGFPGDAEQQRRPAGPRVLKYKSSVYFSVQSAES